MRESDVDDDCNTDYNHCDDDDDYYNDDDDDNSFEHVYDYTSNYNSNEVSNNFYA